MKTERIIKFWRICYLYLFDENGSETRNKFETYKDEKAIYQCQKIFWRIYWVFDKT